MIRWLWAKATGGTLVQLYSPRNLRQGYDRHDPAIPKWIPTISYRLADGRQVARVYWFAKVGGVVLETGGRINPDSESSYITEWREG